VVATKKIVGGKAAERETEIRGRTQFVTHVDRMRQRITEPFLGVKGRGGVTKALGGKEEIGRRGPTIRDKTRVLNTIYNCKGNETQAMGHGA